MGLSHAENISVQAEAYDVALDMSFPKGTFIFTIQLSTKKPTVILV